MKSYLLSIDQGTTGTTVLLLDPSGKVKARAYQSIRQYYPKPGWVEQDPEDIWNSLKKATAKCLRLSRVSSGQIKGIGITNQRETTVLWNPATGKSYHRAIVWQCRRTAHLCERLKQKRGLEREVRRLTGLPLDPYFSGSKVEWLLDHVSGLRKKAAAGKVLFGTIDCYLLWRLTGGRVHATDWTNASRTLLFNIHKKKWDKKLLRLFKVPAKMLPQALPSKSVFGTTKKSAPLPDGIPIAAILGDQQSALFGQGCTHRGEAKNTYGTGSFFMVQLGKKPAFSQHGLITTLSIDEKGESAYALEGSVFISGAAIQWMRDEVRWIKRASDTESIARKFRKLYPNPHVFMVPAFVGLGAPYWDPHARGAFLGITRGTSQQELITATLESLAYPIAELALIFEKETGSKLKVLKVDGGGSQNNYLMQFQADLLGIDIIRPGLVETTALGTAKLAGMNLKFWKSHRPFEKVQLTKFKPKLSKPLRDKLLKLWQDAVKKIL